MQQQASCPAGTMNAIQINDDSSGDAAAQSIMQNKQPQQIHHVAIVSPNVTNGSKIHHYNDSAQNDKEENPTMVLPELHQSSPPKHSHNIHTITPTKTPSPLKSPFRNSMALLDSKLDSLKKEDVALHDKIETMNAWLDGSGMEDSWDGELCFDGWDFGEEELGEVLRGVDESGGGGSDGCFGLFGGVEDDGYQDISSEEHFDGVVGDAACGGHSITGTSTAESVISPGATDSDVHIEELNSSAVQSAQSKVIGFFDGMESPKRDGERSLECSLVKGCEKVGTCNDVNHVVESCLDLESSLENVVCQHEPITNTTFSTDPGSEVRHEVKDTSNLDTDNDPSCKSSLQNQYAQNNQDAKDPSVLKNCLHKTPAKSTKKIDRVSHIKQSLASIREIGQVSNSDPRRATYSVENNQTIFFSPVESCKSQLYLTPYGNVSLESRHHANLFSTASNVGCQSRLAACVEGEIQSNLFPSTEIKCNVPSLCMTDASMTEAPWTEESSYKSEAVNDMSQVMSKLVAKLSLSEPKCTETSSITSHADYNESPSKRPCDADTSPKQNGSPIQPKKLYKCTVDPTTGEDENCIHSKLSSQHNSDNRDFEKESQSKFNDAIVSASATTEMHSIPLPSVSIDERSDEIYSAKRDHNLLQLAPANSASELDRMGHDALVKLVVELRCQLDESSNACEAMRSEFCAVKLERDNLIQANQQFLASKLENEVLITSLETALASKTREINQLLCEAKSNEVEHSAESHCAQMTPTPGHEATPDRQWKSSSFVSDENELEQAIELVASSMKCNGSNLDSSQQINANVCSSCVQYKEQIKALMLQNNQLERDLDALYLSPRACDDTSSPLISPNGNAFAQPVDLETLFNATSCNDHGGSKTSSQYVSSAKLSVAPDSPEKVFLKEQYHHLVHKYHDLESDLSQISAEKNNAIDELEQATSLISLLESSIESLRSDKRIAEQQRDELKIQADGLVKQLAQVRTDLESIKSESQVADERILSLNGKITDLERDRDSALQKLRTAEHRLMEANEEISLISEERNKQEEKIKGLLSDLTDMEEEKAELKHSLSELSFTIRDLQQQILQKDSIIHKFGETMDTMKDERTPQKRASTAVEQSLSPQIKLSTYHVENEVRIQDEGPTGHSYSDRFQSIAAKLSVIVLQQKLRASRANKQLKMNESVSLGLKEKLANTELSLGELNADRRRLAEEIVSLKDENAALSLKLDWNTMNRYSSEALVLEGDSGVEAVNCTAYSSVHQDQNGPEISRCKQNLQSTISHLAAALVKLKIRERSLSNENRTLKENEAHLQSRFLKLQHGLSNVVRQKNLIRCSLYEFKEEVSREILSTDELSAGALIELSSSAASVQRKAQQLLLENQDFMINELQSKNAEVLETNPTDDRECIGKSSIESVNEKADSEQQLEALKDEIASTKENFERTITELKDSHDQEKHQLSDFIATLNSEANDEIGQLKFYLLHEKEASSLLRGQLEELKSTNNELETAMNAVVENNHRFVRSIASLEAESKALTAELLECQHYNTVLSQKVDICEKEAELSKRLQSQLDELNIKVQAEKESSSTMHCELLSLSSERESLSRELASAADEISALRSENESLKHERCTRRDDSDRSDSSARTYNSCEHLGTVCEQAVPDSPGRDIIEILSAPKLSKKDIQHVSVKMHQLHSILAQVQEERSSLKQEVKQLRDFKESSQFVSKDQVEVLLRRNSESYRAHLIQSQNEITRLTRELEYRDRPRVTKFTTPFSEIHDDSNRPQFELSLETPRVSNLASKHHTKASPRYQKSKSPQESKVRSKERFEVKKGISILGMFKDSKKSGRKDFIKYRDASKDSRSVHSSEPESPGEKRKRQQAELMIKSLRRKYDV